MIFKFRAFHAQALLVAIVALFCFHYSEGNDGLISVGSSTVHVRVIESDSANNLFELNHESGKHPVSWEISSDSEWLKLDSPGWGEVQSFNGESHPGKYSRVSHIKVVVNAKSGLSLGTHVGRLIIKTEREQELEVKVVALVVAHEHVPRLRAASVPENVTTNVIGDFYRGVPQALNYRCVLGAPEYVTWPNPTYRFWALPDMTTMLVPGFPDNQVRAVSGFGLTYWLIRGRNLENVLTPPDLLEGLEMNPPFYYTFVIEGAVVEGNTIRAWMHCEQTWRVPAWGANYFIAYTESHDLGRTWNPRRVEPKDVVWWSELDCPRGSPRRCGTGPHWVVDFGNYYYLYTWDRWAEFPDGSHNFALTGICVARSLKRTGGKAGTWFKLYRGQWNQPANRGKCSKIDGMTGVAVSVIEIGGKKMMISANHAGGLPMSVSTDGYNWVRFQGNPIPHYDNDNRAFNFASFSRDYHGWFWGYNSVLCNPSDDRCYLYAMSVPAGATRNDPNAPMERRAMRNLVRYPINFIDANTPSIAPFCTNRVPLVRWLNRRIPTRVWATFMPPDTQIWRRAGIIGYLHTCLTRTSIAIYDCRTETGQYFPATVSECQPGRMAPYGIQQRVYIQGNIGRLYLRSGEGGRTWTQAFYRCYVSATGSFDVAVGRPCPDARFQTLMGYISSQAIDP
mmetsp:Transcript_7635/g.12186  ORF Transcript_7635/g.12186 Transcript_7635/m.12186 type:complete len:677 (+) Transcript_7635:222-2252(+)|eukprot:CAMPEP_0184655514 /NCGR_PEP_ID=MMETSP0308-20130426/13110_1 /TAXON_ID=38269 /ORGANISM="Gloeochaete witrockiana, Strain SAG 46.84" /LENGTH=676 /DNA_ID=CAMNT_0027092011 /DNA_START=217 /DNA_END=2247 /DNA_ORIENTATION=+